MADRTSAALFGKIFDLLAENPTDEHKAIARKIAPETREYDFNAYQMGCDKSLIALGLATTGDEGIEYGDELEG
jgi:hypothetical protein